MSTKQVNHGGQLVVFVVRSFFDTKRLVLHPSYVYTFGEQNALLYFPEAAYLYYEDGGYYNWHMDTPSRERSLDPPKEEEMTKRHRRAFSFLLYLGDGSCSREWTAEDGGFLRTYPPISMEDQKQRIHGKSAEGSFPPLDISGAGQSSYSIGDPAGLTRDDAHRDIVPEEGTLVIFKSEVLPHEVLPTSRERMAMVGWIHGNLPLAS